MAVTSERLAAGIFRRHSSSNISWTDPLENFEGLPEIACVLAMNTVLSSTKGSSDTDSPMVSFRSGEHRDELLRLRELFAQLCNTLAIKCILRCHLVQHLAPDLAFPYRLTTAAKPILGNPLVPDLSNFSDSKEPPQLAQDAIEQRTSTATVAGDVEHLQACLLLYVNVTIVPKNTVFPLSL